MRRPILYILLLQCLVILILIRVFRIDLYRSSFSGCYDTVVTVSGRVRSVQIKDNYTALIIDSGGEDLLIRLYASFSEDSAYDMVGRSVSATGKISEPAAARNPGAFDYRNYLRARRIYTVMTVSKFKFRVGEIKNFPAHMLAAQKGRFIAAAKSAMSPESFAVTAGVLFGDKSYLSDELYEEFRANGIAHVLAVSGLHVGLIYGSVRKLLKRRDLSASALSLILLFIYAALADFSVSVIRASVMIALNIAAFHTQRRYDMFSAACAVAIMLLAVNPYYIFDTGAQLSFLAAYSLAVLLPYFDIKFRKFCDRIKSEKLFGIGSVFIPGFVLQLGMAPLTAFHFMNFSVLGVLINPAAIYLASLLLPVGLFCFLVFPAGAALAAGCAAAEGIVFLLEALSDISFKLCGGISVPAPPLGLLALYYALLFFFFSETRYMLLRLKRRGLARIICSGLTAAACLLPFAFGFSLSPLPWRYDRYDAVFLDVGQGDGAHIYSRGANILIDGGGSYYSNVGKDILRPYLLKNGVTRIDMAIVSHLDIDHCKGIEELSRMMKIKRIVFPVSAKDADLSGFICEEKLFVKAGDIIRAGGAIFTVLSASGRDDNEGSVICVCDNGECKILFMGDAPIEKELLLSFPDVDILKVGHHGSRSSTCQKLLDEARPELAVISCGKNNRYGHPHDRVLELLENSSIIIKRTDLEGAICLKHRNIHTRY